MLSLLKTARALTLVSRSCCSCSELMGRPIRVVRSERNAECQPVRDRIVRSEATNWPSGPRSNSASKGRTILTRRSPGRTPRWVSRTSSRGSTRGASSSYGRSCGRRELISVWLLEHGAGLRGACGAAMHRLSVLAARPPHAHAAFTPRVIGHLGWDAREQAAQCGSHHDRTG